MVRLVRHFLATASRRKTVVSAPAVLDSYDRFLVALPELAALAQLDPADIVFADYERLVIAWVQNN